jgi:hypothetical protein
VTPLDYTLETSNNHFLFVRSSDETKSDQGAELSDEEMEEWIGTNVTTAVQELPKPAFSMAKFGHNFMLAIM